MVASDGSRRLTEGTRMKWGDVRVPVGYDAALQLGTEVGGAEEGRGKKICNLSLRRGRDEWICGWINAN